MEYAAHILGMVTPALIVLLGGGGVVGLFRMQQARSQRTRDQISDHILVLEKQIKLYEAQGESDKARLAREQLIQFLGSLGAQFEVELQTSRRAPDIGSPAPSPDDTAQLKRSLGKAEGIPQSMVSAEWFFLRGNGYYETEEFEKALEAYNLASEGLPDDPDVLAGRGAALYRLRRYEQALDDLQRAAEIGRDDFMYHKSLGRVLQQLGRAEEAAQAYEHASALAPDDADVQRLRQTAQHEAESEAGTGRQARGESSIHRLGELCLKMSNLDARLQNLQESINRAYDLSASRSYDPRPPDPRSVVYYDRPFRKNERQGG